jgi:hypothetical protein
LKNGGTFWTKSELTLTKIRPDFAPPPLADARRRAKYSLHF